MESRKRKIKYPLKMKDDCLVRTVEEFREHFDLIKMLEYAFTTVEGGTGSDGTLKNAKLTNWLRLRYYEDEADAISELREDDPQLAEKLCSVLGAEYPKDQPNITDVQKSVQRKAFLRRFTTDETILSNPRAVALTQEDFEYLYTQTAEQTIYLLSVDNIPFVFRQTWLTRRLPQKTVLQGIILKAQKPNIMPEEVIELGNLEQYVILKDIVYLKSNKMKEIEKSRARIAAFDKRTMDKGLVLGTFKVTVPYHSEKQDMELIWQILEEDEEGYLLGTMLSIDQDDFRLLGLNYLQIKSREMTYLLPKSSGERTMLCDNIYEKSFDPFQIKMPYSFPESDLRSFFPFHDYPITFLSKDEKNKYQRLFGKEDELLFEPYMYREETFRNNPKLYFNIISDNGTYLCIPVIYLKKETLLRYYLREDI